MPKIIFITKDNNEVCVEAEVGMSLLVTAQDHDIGGLPGVCNGCCSCGTCHIELMPDETRKISPMYSGEKQVLETLRKRGEHSRLACQIIVEDKLDGMRVKVK